MVRSSFTLSFLLAGLTACASSGAALPDDAGSSWTAADASPGSEAGLPLPRSDGGAPPPPDGAALPTGDAGRPEADAAAPAACPEVTEGRNVIMVGGAERAFWVNSPPPSATPRAVVFWFHGFSAGIPPATDALNDSAMLDRLGVRPGADPSFPFVRVLLEDTGLLPLAGLDWDIRTDSPNRDLELFDTVLACLVAHRDVAPDRVFAAGFSAGATFANLLHSARGDVVRAIYTASGLWPNEPLNLELAHRVTFGAPLVDWDWPALAPIERGAGAVLLTHGGPGDNVPGSPNPTPSNLTEAGRAAAAALAANGRVVVECQHDGGHALHPEVTGELVLRFFAAHVGDGPSPWLTAAPPMPASCALRLP